MLRMKYLLHKAFFVSFTKYRFYYAEGTYRRCLCAEIPVQPVREAVYEAIPTHHNHAVVQALK